MDPFRLKARGRVGPVPRLLQVIEIWRNLCQAVHHSKVVAVLVLFHFYQAFPLSKEMNIHALYKRRPKQEHPFTGREAAGAQRNAPSVLKSRASGHARRITVERGES